MLEPSFDLELFSTIYWAIWHRRNKVRLNKAMDKVDHIPVFARGYLEEFKACQTITSPSSPSQPQARWKKPTTCGCKVNYDGAVFVKSSEVGIGVVFRNANGTPVATLS
jgi:hypothetical protein